MQGIVLVCSCSTSSVSRVDVVFLDGRGSGDPWSWPEDWIALSSIGNLNAIALHKQQNSRGINNCAGTKELRKGGTSI